MEKLLRNTLLYDFYGELLATRQKNMHHMYFFEDMTMEEIGERLEITRQSVNHSLKQAQKNLENFEEKLGMIALYDAVREQAKTLENALVNNDNERAGAVLKELKELF